MNQAKIVKLSRAADTIVIGNPEIADASVQDASTVVLTGKGFGVTNLVILDDTGAPIIDEQVMVSRSTASTLRIYRRASVQTLSCTPYCESSYKTDAERQSEEDMSSEHKRASSKDARWHVEPRRTPGSLTRGKHRRDNCARQQNATSTGIS